MVVSENNMAASITQRGKYIGQTKKLLRNGYGVYSYENQFFKYEGEWKNGKKHGHGKLIMKDGTFLEGQFVEGEIQGHGYKFFATSGSKYTGNFERGELHGYGIMQYPDGTMFEGEWAHNRKQGFGVLKTGDNSTYQGEFVGSMRHGQGVMYYDNGDRYNGYWVMDKRQGHGELHCRDGSHYEGQWMNDMFHGEGEMKHASGIIYRGQWINGYPAEMATKMSIVLETDPLELQQGDTFSIRVECRNDGDMLVKDEGRELRVSAGFKHYPTKAGSALFDMIEDVEEVPVETPFGYSMVSYPLSDNLAPEEETTEETTEETKDGEGQEAPTSGEGGPSLREGEKVEEGQTKPEAETVTEDEVKESKEETKIEDATEIEKEKEEEKEETGVKEEKTGEEKEKNEGQPSSRPTSPSQATVTEPATDPAVPPPEDTPLPPPVVNQRTVGGVCEWACLQLAPPPPMYRPFLAIEEEAAQKKKGKKGTPAKDKSLDKSDNKGSKKDGKDKTSQENVMDEAFARPGEYVIMVQDITSPPFFSRVLPPAFAIVNILKPKPKKKESKPNSPVKECKERDRWDTRKHIAAAMQRQVE